MRVYELNGASGLESVTLTVRPEPEPLRGQILIAMKAWSLNYRDLLIINDNYNGLRPNHIIALSDGAGEVVAVGPDVTRFKVGDRVSPTFSSSWVAGPMTAADPPRSRGAAVDGVLAELVACDELQAVHIPAHLSFQEAACLPCAGVTAWNALFGPRPLISGQSVLTLGTGGVSTFAIQFAAAAGARVISTSSSDDKLDTARKLGATDTINYRTFPEWQQEVLRLTEGRGVDHVVEVGGGGTIDRSVMSAAVGAQIHMIGALSTGTLSPRMLVPWKTLRGIMVGSTADHRSMNRMIEHHQIRPFIGKVFPFDAAIDAYRHLESASHVGKIVIKLGSQ
ncbi:Alcohol dehydrogenase [Paraburkholderia unamae]|uniref:zinc-dependent alcohol dehydrogenase family protein n=1 Tax=Paraburkholderia unamae TaxID=219649 RepID=UPI001CB66B7B|nr:NAD(P)-dependent alcohol dehydrogenase [Paraburkholderia unamae]CAG9272934.1 Alcohol dehydrogenase [Paraburkholderia unamae]